MVTKVTIFSSMCICAAMCGAKNGWQNVMERHISHILCYGQKTLRVRSSRSWKLGEIQWQYSLLYFHMYCIQVSRTSQASLSLDPGPTWWGKASWKAEKIGCKNDTHAYIYYIHKILDTYWGKIIRDNGKRFNGLSYQIQIAQCRGNILGLEPLLWSYKRTGSYSTMICVPIFSVYLLSR